MNIVSLDQLYSVAVQESHQEMQVIQEMVPEADCHYIKFDMVELLGNKFYLRSGAIERLREASYRLRRVDSRYVLRVVYAYRHPCIQKRYFDRALLRVAQEYPTVIAQELKAKAHMQVAVPEVAGHPTGGAVDVTLLRESIELDFGTKIADFSDPDKIQTFSEKITSEQYANRMFLRSVMMSADFAPFDGEWWHFSFGDREWAAYYKKPYAIYDQVELG